MFTQLLFIEWHYLTNLVCKYNIRPLFFDIIIIIGEVWELTMYLNKLDITVINVLVRDPNIEVKSMLSRLEITKRQLDYSLKKIEGLFDDEIGLQISTGQFDIESHTVKLLTSLLDQQQGITYVPTEQERSLLILLILIQKSSSDVSLQCLAKKLSVSRNTISNDLKTTGHYLDNYDLEITYNRIDGFKIKGNEKKVRNMIYNLSLQLIHLYDHLNYFYKLTSFDVSKVESQLKVLEKDYDIHLSDEGFKALVYNIALNSIRIKNGEYIETEFEANIPKRFKDVYKYFGFTNIPEQEKKWMSLQILVSNVIVDNKKVGDETLKLKILEFLENFERVSYLNIDKSEEFIDRLETHIRPVIYRVQLGISDENTEEPLGLENYTYLNELVRISLHPIKELIGAEIPQIEINYITLYIGSEMLRQGINLVNHKKALIVCSSGFATSKMLFYTLKEIFPNFTFIGSLSFRQFETYIGDYDLVFSTVPIQSDIPVYLVNPIMSYDEKRKLFERVSKRMYTFNLPLLDIDRIVEIVTKNAENIDEANLRFELKQELSNKHLLAQNNEELLDGLSYYLPQHRIYISNMNLSIGESIKKSCAPLIDEGIILEAYVNELIELVNQNHSYIYIRDDIIIPHVESVNVLKDGFSLLILNNPVTLFDKQIRAILPIAIKDSTKHFKAIRQLYTLIENEHMISKIFQSKTSAQVFKVIDDLNEGFQYGN